MEYQGLKHGANGLLEPVLDAMVIEKPLRILINNEPFTITLRMPGNEKELVMGLLYAEDILKKNAALSFNYIEGKDELDTVNATIRPDELKEGYLNSRNFLSVSSCGMCGKTDLPIIIATGSTPKVTDWIPASVHLEALFDKMKEHQLIFKQTGGCHAAAAFTAAGELLSCKEDIGRHNAVDKVVGDLLLQNRLKEAYYLLVSGRVSYEIIVKTFRANIPVLAAVSAPSSLAIDYAKELGIRLIGFCRGNQYTLYS